MKKIIEKLQLNEYAIVTVGLSLLGRHHEKRGLKNQDSIAYFAQNGYVALAVADGVGSCEKSDRGSLLATEVVSELVEAITYGRIHPSWEEKFKDFIIKSWERKVGSKLEEHSTTLRIAIVCENYILAVHIGDGKTIINIGDVANYISEDDDLFSNETYSLTEVTDPNRIKIMQIDIPPNTEQIGIFISTDGISNEIASGKENEFLNFLIRNAKPWENEEFRSLAEWVMSLQKKNGDDKSLMLFVAERSTTNG